MYAMDVEYSAKGYTASIIVWGHDLHTAITHNFSWFSQYEETLAVVTVWVCAAICPSTTVEGVLKNLLYVCHGCEVAVWKVLQPQQYWVVAWYAHFHHLGFQLILPNLGWRLWWWWCEFVCSHMPIHNCWRCSNNLYMHAMDVRMLHSLNHSVVAWFAHFHHLRFQLTLPHLR